MTPTPKKTIASIAAGTAAAALIMTGVAYGDRLLPTSASSGDSALVDLAAERRIFEAEVATPPALEPINQVDAKKIAAAKRRAEKRAEERAQEAQAEAARVVVEVADQQTAAPAVTAAPAEEPASQASPYGDDEYDDDDEYDHEYGEYDDDGDDGDDDDEYGEHDDDDD